MEIELGKLPFDIDFHPSNQLVAAGLITGDLLLYRYASNSTPQRALEVNVHSESCRTLRFINEGQAIVTGSPDCSIIATDVATGSTVARLENAHGAAINRIVNLTESTIASGDDEGCVKVWDTRQRSCCNSFNVHEEYISDMTFASDSMKLLATSGDGTLSVCNLRSSKVSGRSEFSEDELLSIVIMKNGRKVICGTQTGTLLLYSWGFFKDCSDRFIDLSPNSVDALLKLDEDRVITGCENGLISLVGILPNRIIQPIAEHSEYPVERLAFSHDKKFLGSISHDQKLKFENKVDPPVTFCSCGIWMTYCKVQETLQMVAQLLQIVIVMGWMLMIIFQKLLKGPRGKMLARAGAWAVQTVFLLIFSKIYIVTYLRVITV